MAFSFGLAELINERFAPYRERYNALEKDPDYVEDVLRESGKKARVIAQETMEKVRAATGILTATQELIIKQENRP